MSFTVNVPSVPGVPAVISVPGVSTILNLLTGDAISLFAGLTKAPWGIYLGFLPVVPADTVTAFDFDQQFDISDFPVEQGQFASYNKVYRPFEPTLEFSRGGTIAERQEMLDALNAIVGTTQLFNVVTADATYTNVNIVGYSYSQRADSGVGLMRVSVRCRQVMETGIGSLLSTIVNAIDPSADSQINGGTVQAIAPTGAQLGALPSLIGAL